MKVQFVKPLNVYSKRLLYQIFEVCQEDKDKYYVKNKQGGTHWFYKAEVRIIKEN